MGVITGAVGAVGFFAFVVEMTTAQLDTSSHIPLPMSFGHLLSTVAFFDWGAKGITEG